MNTNEIFISILLPTLVLLIGLIDDLWFRKFHNWLFLSLLVFTLCALTLIDGSLGIIKGSYSLALSFALSLPLVLLGVMGAGDMKLLMVFALATSTHTVFNVIVMAFLWGGILGLLYAMISGRFATLLLNLKGLLIYQIKPTTQSLHTIPYTVPICLAWFTHLLIMPYYEVQLWS